MSNQDDKKKTDKKIKNKIRSLKSLINLKVLKMNNSKEKNQMDMRKGLDN